MIENPFRGQGLELDGIPWPSTDADAPLALLSRCPEAGETPMRRWRAGPDGHEVWVKDERDRMGLGSFKALGAAYVIAHAELEGEGVCGRSFVTASAGNHGLSVAAGAAAFGARAVIYLAATVPEGFAGRLRDMGAEVRRAGDTYEQSMEAAAGAAREHGWTLLSDSSWPGYVELPHRLMEGYLVLAEEARHQMPAPPTHILLQAGVGGLAAAAAAHFRKAWGNAPRIIVVEPEAAPALYDSIQAGSPVIATGPVSVMGRLDCKEPSLIALRGLSRDADAFALISEVEAQAVMDRLAAADLATTPSGGAGLAALVAGAVSQADARVLCVLSEAP